MLNRILIAALGLSIAQGMLAQSPLTQVPPTPGRAYQQPHWDLGVFVQGGNGLEDRTSFHFLSAGAYLGRILTDDHTSLRANFEYGVEVLPLWQSYTPTFQRLSCPTNATVASQCKGPTTTGGTYRGLSVVPIILRINMNHGEKLQPWLQGCGRADLHHAEVPAHRLAERG